MNIPDLIRFRPPEWSYNANIYEVNLRQYTKEGTFRAFSEELSRLADMGVKILWFMPITPISVKGRLGTLGSYYAAKDYTSTNPEFGTLEDFKNLINEAHLKDFKVILDFVANHTGNDHHWINDHPDYYRHNAAGDIMHPPGWEDVAQLNFDNKEVWNALIDAMEFWVRECDIDGFRCDMAHLVPLQLWINARTRLDAIKKDMFWLAECEVPAYHQAFDATYTWRWMHASEHYYQRKLTLNELKLILFTTALEFPCGAFRTYFTSNHDENSWNGTEYEKYGEAAHLFAVFSFTWDGIPMLYSGQEMPNNKRLKFFDKDPIKWTGEYELHDFYKKLMSVKKNNPALLSGGKTYTKLMGMPHEERVFSYLRTSMNGDEVLTALNLSADNLYFHLQGLSGAFRDVFTGATVRLTGDDWLPLPPWGYLVYERIRLNLK